MRNKEITLKPKKEGLINKISKLFEDKKTRFLRMILFILPLVILIGVFSFVAVKEVKNIIDLATNSNETKESHQITSMSYELRNNATEIQEEYFKELKEAIESSASTDAEAAGLLCKNFVADFYTWTNKSGQYDVGGMCYVYTGTSKQGEFKTLLYTQARDSFYKYINNYINEYGSKDLIEVETVDVIKADKLDDLYIVNELISKTSSETEAYVFDYVYDDVGYDAYYVTCSWTYKQTEKFDTSKYPTKMDFVVVLHGGRFEIVEASSKKIDIKVEEEIEDVLEEAED